MANDDELALEGVREEAEAYNSYKRKARESTDTHTREVFDDVADEELVHLGEFSEVAEETRPEIARKVKEGYDEAKDVKKSDADFIPSFEDMLKAHRRETCVQKSGGGPTCNTIGTVFFGRGKRYPGVFRAHDAIRDSVTGQFSQKKDNSEGCHKEEVKITGLDHMGKTEQSATESIEKTTSADRVKNARAGLNAAGKMLRLNNAPNLDKGEVRRQVDNALDLARRSNKGISNNIEGFVRENDRADEVRGQRDDTDKMRNDKWATAMGAKLRNAQQMFNNNFAEEIKDYPPVNLGRTGTRKPAGKVGSSPGSLPTPNPGKPNLRTPNPGVPNLENLNPGDPGTPPNHPTPPTPPIGIPNFENFQSVESKPLPRKKRDGLLTKLKGLLKSAETTQTPESMKKNWAEMINREE